MQCTSVTTYTRQPILFVEVHESGIRPIVLLISDEDFVMCCSCVHLHNSASVNCQNAITGNKVHHSRSLGLLFSTPFWLDFPRFDLKAMLILKTLSHQVQLIPLPMLVNQHVLCIAMSWPTSWQSLQACLISACKDISARPQ